MRVGLILPARSQQWGGVQRFATALHRAMAERVDTESVRIHPRPNENRLEGFVKGWSSLWQAHRERHFDIVFTTFHYPPSVWPGIPMVGFVHDLRSLTLHAELGQDRRSRWSPEAMAMRAIFKSWRRILVPTSHVRRDVERLAPPSTVVAVGEGVDHLPDSPHRLNGRADRDAIVLIAGRAPHKRALLGLETAERLVDLVGAQVFVVGTLPRTPKTPLIVTCPPSLDDAALAALLCRARVTLVPTRYEGFGLAAGEAMWAGSPVVYCNDSTLSAVVGTGGLGTAPNPESMASAAAKLWDGDASANARDQADRWTWAQTADRVVAQLREVVATRHVVTRYPEG
jgi:glycosyltransferase involved in cell wall biosynthesis